MLARAAACATTANLLSSSCQLSADHPRPEVPQLPAGGGVKRQRLHRTHAGAGLRGGVQAAQPAAHLPRGALGERHRQHLARRDVAGADEVGDPVGDGAGLTRSGARQHAHRTAAGEHRRALLVVQSGDESLLGLPWRIIMAGTGDRSSP